MTNLVENKYILYYFIFLPVIAIYLTCDTKQIILKKVSQCCPFILLNPKVYASKYKT